MLSFQQIAPSQSPTIRPLCQNEVPSEPDKHSNANLSSDGMHQFVARMGHLAFAKCLQLMQHNNWDCVGKSQLSLFWLQLLQNENLSSQQHCVVQLKYQIA